MTRDELAGYTVLIGFGLVLVLAIKVFGVRRVVMALLGVVLIALTLAFGTLRAMSSRR